MESDSPECYYRRVLVVPILDHMLNQMKIRFDEKSMVASKLLSIIPSVIVTLDEAAVPLCDLKFWETDLPTPHLLTVSLKRIFFNFNKIFI